MKLFLMYHNESINLIYFQIDDGPAASMQLPLGLLSDVEMRLRLGGRNDLSDNERYSEYECCVTHFSTFSDV